MKKANFVNVNKVSGIFFQKPISIENFRWKSKGGSESKRFKFIKSRKSNKIKTPICLPKI